MNEIEMNSAEDVRRHAEKIAAQMSKETASLSPEVRQNLLHELQVHQIELEIQNEELRRTQLELEAARARYFDLYDLAPVGYITLSKQGIIVEANLTLVDLLGVTRKQVVKRPLTRFIFPSDQDIFYHHYRQLFATGAPQICELRLLRATGDPFWAQLEAAITPQTDESAPTSRIIISDIGTRKQAALALRESYHRLEEAIDELREAQSQLVQQERLAAVGQLAAGIAHDFNNILAVITLYIDMSLGTPALPDRLQQRLETIGHQSRRAADLVQQILDFGRRTVLQTHLLNLTTLLQEQVELLRRTIPESIKIHFAAETADCLVNADPTRLQQLFTNLVLNARDAMPDGGDLRLSVEQLHWGQRDTVPLPGMAAGDWACITVSDSGTGILATTLPHVFEPFFTTKGPGQGSGLGLAQVYGIVKQHKGYIDVQSTAGRGTTFTIYLPALVATSPAETVVALPPALQGQGETILVVEDNELLREALASSLVLLNYKVVTAADGREALAILEQDSKGERPGPAIALVLSDLVMPNMGGEALLQVMRQRGLSVPFLILSGHPMGAERRQSLQAQGCAGWLLKPIGTQELATAVARALPGSTILN
jgi:two-component system, cell cycle sensor histidine kinase and response regulator CckA